MIENATETLQPITKVASRLGLSPDDLISYGKFKAKIPLDIIYAKPRRAKLVLVTATNPTPLGEGKTTLSIGLSQALNQAGVPTTAVLREPSLGPTLGMKGGATGGGLSQVLPADDINLHFTGDFHAITSAHNLLSALLDNALYFGQNSLSATKILWRRVLDMNDRALRHIVIGLGGAGQGIPRETGFDITAASEVMAVLSLARDLPDLEHRLGKMIVAIGNDGQPVTVQDLGAARAMTALLKDAMMPNLVQTSEHTPAIIHAGPFANIAHGCNSLVATEAGLRFSDVVITEAGFGADLGAEKFLDIKATAAQLQPDLAVLVVTLRSIKYQGGVLAQDAAKTNSTALAGGFANVEKHIENLQRFGLPVIVAINRFGTDSPEEIRWVQEALSERGVSSEVAEVFSRGGQGGRALANAVRSHLASHSAPEFRPLYSRDLPLQEKIQRIARDIYGASQIEYHPAAMKKLKRFEDWGENHLAVCMAKTQYSLSDDPTLLGRPEGFTFHIRDIEIARGAGYIVPLAGTMVRMPGLPKSPHAYRLRVADNGSVQGIE